MGITILISKNYTFNNDHKNLEEFGQKARKRFQFVSPT